MVSVVNTGSAGTGGGTGAGSVLGVLSCSVTAIEDLLADFEPGTLSGSDAGLVLDTFAKGERLCAAGKALCAARAVAANAHKGGDSRTSPAAWLAKRTGDSVGEAMAALASADGAATMGHLDRALRSGELSPARAACVANAVSAVPGAEEKLVDVAKGASMQALRRRCAQVKAGSGASAQSESDRYMGLHRSRYLRHWSDPDGALRLDARLTPDEGARVLARIAPLANELFDDARRHGRRESPQAYAADALVGLVTGDVGGTDVGGTDVGGTDVGGTDVGGTDVGGTDVGGTDVGGTDPGEADGSGRTAGSPDPVYFNPVSRRAAPPGQLIVRVDAAALRRGYVQGNECCEVPGVGPVPVATAQGLLGDAWLRLVITDGVDIATVCHMGRTVGAHLRTALQERDPTCVVPGCEVAHGLEIDHWRVDYAEGGPTCLDNLARLCHAHHLAKTHRGYVLAGGPRHWTWSHPVGPLAPPGPPGHDQLPME